MRRKNFTLLELAAVIAILVLLTTVASVYIGKERKQAAFERALRDFQIFCARARAESMLDGKVRKLLFYPDEKVFRIEVPEDWNQSPAVIAVEEVEDGNMPYVVLDAIDPDWENEMAETEESGDSGDSAPENTEPVERKWAFPESLGVAFELPALEGTAPAEESLELWRFVRGGSARMTHRLTVQLNEDVRTVAISDFTGLVEITEGTGEEGRIVW